MPGSSSATASSARSSAASVVSTGAPNVDSHLASPLANSVVVRVAFVVGALLGASGVALSALDAHLPHRFFVPAAGGAPDGRLMLHTAGSMALWQGIALCAIALGAHHLRPRPARGALVGLAIGALLFCTTVTLRAFGAPCLPFLAPLGGTMLIAAWLFLACALPRSN